jgi:hypothetical protein
MDERAINGAAIEAIRDLELDCEIKEVVQASGADQWCIQFSGKYGQFCDEFKNQFGEESSPQVLREKIKSHLIKQVSKIRSGTGRKRKAVTVETEESRETGSKLLAEPLRMVGEVFERLTGITGIVVDQATTAAETARDALADAASNLSPLTIEVRGKTRRSETRAPTTASKTSTRTAKGKSASPRKATKRAAPAARKQAKKASKKAAAKAAGKAVGRAQKAKAAKKSSRPGK